MVFRQPLFLGDSADLLNGHVQTTTSLPLGTIRKRWSVTRCALSVFCLLYMSKIRFFTVALSLVVHLLTLHWKDWDFNAEWKKMCLGLHQILGAYVLSTVLSSVSTSWHGRWWEYWVTNLVGQVKFNRWAFCVQCRPWRTGSLQYK